MIAVLVYSECNGQVQAEVLWVDPFAGSVLNRLVIPVSPNLGLFPAHDCLLVSYEQHSESAPATDWLDILRLSDFSFVNRLQMDYRAHFNVSPSWSTFLPSPADNVIYM